MGSAVIKVYLRQDELEAVRVALRDPRLAEVLDNSDLLMRALEDVRLDQRLRRGEAGRMRSVYIDVGVLQRLASYNIRPRKRSVKLALLALATALGYYKPATEPVRYASFVLPEATARALSHMSARERGQAVVAFIKDVDKAKVEEACNSREHHVKVLLTLPQSAVDAIRSKADELGTTLSCVVAVLGRLIAEARNVDEERK